MPTPPDDKLHIALSPMPTPPDDKLRIALSPMPTPPDDKLRIARRVALELKPGQLVILGIGIPTLVTKFIAPESGLFGSPIG